MKRFSGFHELYDKYRPVLPEEIKGLLCEAIGTSTPELIVDLGCGTGNSTIIWSEIAKYSIGIDSNRDMIDFARKEYKSEKVDFQHRSGSDTKLLDKSVDIVTCSSSIHWMEPVTTFKEIVRILKPGGVFAAYGPQIPYFLPEAWDIANHFNVFWEKVKAAEKKSSDLNIDRVWKWGEISSFIKTQSLFQYFNELTFSQKLIWSSTDYMNWIMTLSPVNALLKEGNHEIVEALSNFEKSLIITTKTKNSYAVHLSYRMLLGII